MQRKNFRNLSSRLSLGFLTAVLGFVLASQGAVIAQTNSACPTMKLATIQCKDGTSLCLYKYTDCGNSNNSWTCWALCSSGLSKCDNGSCVVDNGTPPTSNLGVPNQVTVYVDGSQETKYYRANRSVATTTIRLVDTSPTNWGANGYVVTFVKNVRMTFNSGTQGYAALYTIAPQGNPNDVFQFGIRLDSAPTTFEDISSQALVVQFPQMSRQEFQGIDSVNGNNSSYHVIGGY